MDDSSPSLTLGLIADVQYGQKATRIVEERIRAYSEALPKLREAVDAFNQVKPAFVVQLGDLIDGNVTQDATEADVIAVLSEFKQISSAIPLYHVIGNHCVVLDRSRLCEQLKLDHAYYSWKSHGYRFVVVDAVDVNIRWPQGTPNHEEALAWLEDTSQALQLVPWNGGLTKTQLDWLAAELADAKTCGERVIVFSHIPTHPESSDARHVLYNYEAVLSLLKENPVVVAWIAGHYHPGGYFYADGVHHLTLQAVLEAPKGSTAYGLADLYPDRLVLRGFGTVPSRTLLWS